MKVLTPDTNFWLHAELPFDFIAAAGTAEVVVVVPQIVLSELDRHQHDGRRHLKTRARQRLMAFRKLTRTGVKRSFAINDPAGASSVIGIEATDERGVTYWLVPTAAVPGSADDRIVATAAQLSAEADTAILTADASPEMTARLLGVEVVSVPPEMLNHDEADPLEQEVAQLKREVKKLRSPQELDATIEAQRLWPLGMDVTLQRLGLPTDDQLAEVQRSIVARMAYPRDKAASSPARDAYLSAVEKYADAIRRYLLALARYNTRAEAAVEVQLLLTNRTAEPVNDAVIEIHAPTGVALGYPPDRPRPPTPPTPPRPPDIPEPFAMRTQLLAGILGSNLANVTIPRMPIALPPTAPRIHTEERFAEVKLGEPLRPFYETYGGRLWVALDPEYRDEDIRLPYVLYAAVAGRPIRGEMVIQVSHRREPWAEPALPTYSDPVLRAATLDTQLERKLQSEAERAVQAERESQGW